MKKQILAACLLALSFCGVAHAAPITFIDVQYEATAIALTNDGAPGFQSQSGALVSDVFSVSADSVGTNGLATAGAVVGPGLLATSADVSASDVASAVATARLVASFLNDGPVKLAVDFGSFDFGTGTGQAATSLFVLLMSDGVTLFSDFVASGWQYAYSPLPGTTSVLDLTLSTEVHAAFPDAAPGGASGFGLVTVTGTVPEPTSALLCGLGLAILASTRVRMARRPDASLVAA